MDRAETDRGMLENFKSLVYVQLNLKLLEYVLFSTLEKYGILLAIVWEHLEIEFSLNWSNLSQLTKSRPIEHLTNVDPSTEVEDN